MAITIVRGMLFDEEITEAHVVFGPTAMHTHIHTHTNADSEYCIVRGMLTDVEISDAWIASLCSKSIKAQGLLCMRLHASWISQDLEQILLSFVCSVCVCTWLYAILLEEPV